MRITTTDLLCYSSEANKYCSMAYENDDIDLAKLLIHFYLTYIIFFYFFFSFLIDSCYNQIKHSNSIINIECDSTTKIYLLFTIIYPLIPVKKPHYIH